MAKNVIVGVSGGPDSMNLLHKIRRSFKYNPVVVHINYELRDEAEAETEMLRKFCKSNEIELFVFYKKDLSNKFPEISNDQFRYRMMRYDKYYEVSKKKDAKILFLGHNKDDFIETAIMQSNKSNDFLFYGIRDGHFKDLIIKRPLLKKYKNEIVEYDIKKKIPFSIDSSNFEDIYERNRIRIKLSDKTIKEKNEIYKNFNKINKSNQVEDRLITKQVRIFKESKYSRKTLLSFVNKKEVLRRTTLTAGENINVTSKKLDSIIDFIQANNGKKYKLMDNLFIKVNEGKIILIVENGNRK